MILNKKLIKAVKSTGSSEIKIFLLKNKGRIILMLLIAGIVLMNFQPGKIVMGFDNVSPYFSSQTIIDKVLGGEPISFITYNPLLLFVPILSFFRLINIPPWLISQIYIFSSMCFGIFGAAKLTSFILKKRGYQKTDSSSLLGGIFYFTTLVFAWIYNLPNFYFVAAYASIPWITLWLTRAIQKPLETQDINLSAIFEKLTTDIPKKILMLYITILFLQTSLNLVAFASYTFAVIILAVFINASINSQVQIKKLGFLIITCFSGWLLLLQAQIWLSGQTISVFRVFRIYFNNLEANPVMGDITEGITRSTLMRGDLLNTVRFAGSWMELHNINNKPFFRFYDLYNSPLLTIISLIPFFLSVFSLYKPLKDDKIKLLHIPMALGVLFSSKLLLQILPTDSVLSKAFRWNSSKFWPLLLIPMLPLASIGALKIGQYLKSKQAHLQYVYAIVLIQIIFIIPVISGNLFADEIFNRLPDQYFETTEKINSSVYPSKTIYMPLPQELYFYSYEWGYYGSDFLSYMTRGEGTTSGILTYFNNTQLYQSIDEPLTQCNRSQLATILKENNIEHIVFDTNLRAYPDTNSKQMLNCIKDVSSKNSINLIIID